MPALFFVKVPNFNYGDTLTRLPRLTEFVSATNSLAFLNLTNHNSLSTYSFLFENLGTIKGYWFEEVASSSKTEGWVVNNTSKSITKVSTGSTEYGTRPVIVVEKENVFMKFKGNAYEKCLGVIYDKIFIPKN